MAWNESLGIESVAYGHSQMHSTNTSSCVLYGIIVFFVRVVSGTIWRRWTSFHKLSENIIIFVKCKLSN